MLIFLSFLKDNWLKLLIVIALLVGGYLVYSSIHSANTAIEKQKEKEAEVQIIRVTEAEKNVNAISSNINAVNNANYSNVNDDELRNQIINASRNRKK